MAKSAGSYIFNFVRGGAVGTSEALPGISGGTVALIVGLYEKLIGGAGHVVSGIKLTVTDGLRGQGMSRAKEKYGEADWHVLLPALAGMVVFLLIALLTIEPLLHDYEQYAYALFFGLVLASVWIPFSGAGLPWRPHHYLIALGVAAAAFFLTSLPAANLPAHPVVVFFAAAVAICALVLPGMSGSFILLTVGLYEPTLQAVRTVDMGYILTFAAGAITGLALFVKILQYLLDHKRQITLVVLTGVMAGSLRALWPWQDESRDIQPPTDVPATVSFLVLGFVVVAAALVWEHRKRARIEHEAGHQNVSV
ncbi:DUF368 domain-containing protein [Nocardiopsis sp. MG754419]|uniref:DUF368 domain-containing protein n=1 Tax=Nocardiopsis sp. MG754419 TaxID=2259865 RepID=UPI001BA682C6|nr:DUF368 domain-containing protein [Nocardiopsis sp. MG754419]MBR8740691.1 DUF368 domain-containing protein [Nocardiopsis sp. MG754419]